MTHYLGSDKLALFSFASLLILAMLIDGFVKAELISLTSALPKLQAIHEDAKSLLIKNVELKNKILSGLQQQNEAKIKQVKEIKSLDSAITTASATTTQTTQSQSLTSQPTTSVKPALIDQFNKQQHSRQNNEATKTIDYNELEEFNRWVETNLEYAVKNTQASAEALKEEAQLNNGNVDYSEQAIKDGIEGVKYWQSAVIFQDKTLKNETYESSD